MAATFWFCEDNGTQTGSPLHGTTQYTTSPGATDVNWKNVDDCTANSGTAYSSAPITAGNNSYSKYQYGKFSGTYNSILNGLWSAHTAGTSPMGTGLTLKGTVTSTYATPATTTNSALTTDFSSTVAIGSGLAVDFSATSPQAASPSTTLSSGGGFTQYLVTQLQTTSSAAAGDTASITGTLSYNEN
jgi:hypothetical protein